MSFWGTLEEQVASGRVPGYVAGLGQDVRWGGAMALDGPPMREDTLFRIASITKPIGGALTLRMVDAGLLGLDEPIGLWLPELAEPRVLRAPDAPLDSTVPARRAITVRDLLRFTSGWGAIFERTPLQRAMLAAGVYPGPIPPPLSGDEFVARIAGLPLLFHPGEGWLYDTSIEILGVLLARAGGKSLSELLRQHITGPLGMVDTAFHAVDVERLATAYTPREDGLHVLDPPDGAFAAPGRFEMLGGGLVSTAGDLLRFFTGVGDVSRMTTDALDDTQRAMARPFLLGATWGLGTAIWPGGRWGWDGGTGTSARVDPRFTGVILTQRAMTGPHDGFEEVWAKV